MLENTNWSGRNNFTTKAQDTTKKSFLNLLSRGAFAPWDILLCAPPSNSPRLRGENLSLPRRRGRLGGGCPSPRNKLKTESSLGSRAIFYFPTRDSGRRISSNFSLVSNPLARTISMTPFPV